MGGTEWTTEDVRLLITWSHSVLHPSPFLGERFDRWLAAHDAEVRAQALGDAAIAYTDFGYGDDALVARRWLRNRARAERGEA